MDVVDIEAINRRNIVTCCKTSTPTEFLRRTFLVRPWRHGPALFAVQNLPSRRGGENMSSISCHRSSRLGLGATRTLPAEPSVFFADLWKAFQLFAVALTAVTLAACAQSSVFTDHSALAPGRQASLDSHTKASFVSNRHVAFVAKERASSTTQEHAKETRDASYGLASFYGNGSETASGERFNADELTAAHRTLPFGTRVRVTNHSNGRSVVVRINDRGPFVTGRIIDVTPAAAHALGMSGLAPVTVERE
jgi:rare lipoprotein A